MHEDREFIIEKDVADDVDTHIHIIELFARLGWDPLPIYIYPQLMCELYANMDQKDKYRRFYLKTIVRGQRIELIRIWLAMLLGC